MFEPDASTIYVGDIPSEQAPVPVGMRLRSAVPLTNFKVQTAEGLADVRATAETDRRWQLAVLPKRTLAPGPFNVKVAFHGEGGAGKVYSGAVSVKGKVLTDIETMPESILLGGLPQGERVDLHVTIRCRRPGLRLREITADADCSHIKVRALGQGDAGARFQLNVHVEGRGETKGRVMFQAVASDGRRLPVAPLEVSFYGMGS